MWVGISAFLTSLLVCFLIIVLAKRINLFLSDHLHRGPQTFHKNPTPRIGGVGIFLGLVFALLMSFYREMPYAKELALAMISALPVFLVGLVEDLTGRLKAKVRLAFMFISPVLAFVLLDASLKRVDIPVLDGLMEYTLFSYAFTALGLVGLANAINIIDGFNGLASMVSVIILLALGYVSFVVGDPFLTALCLATIGATLGFFFLNYPNGLIFMGDGGAYLLGFIIGLVSVLLVNRHEEVSAWFPFLVCIYPIFEVAFSVYRRVMIKGSSPFMPDALHLHTIIYKKLTKKLLGPSADKLRRNATTSPFLWLLTSFSVIPAVLFWKDGELLIVFSVLFVFVYVYFYWKLLIGRVPLPRR